MPLLGLKFDVISFYDVIYLIERQWSVRAFKLLKTEPFLWKYIFHSCIIVGTPLTMVDLRENKR